MAAEINGIAHIQLTVVDVRRGLRFWEELCHFMGMKTLLKNDDTVYCIGGRTGILVRGVPTNGDPSPFNQLRPGLHHFCIRARSRDDVDKIHARAVELGAKVVQPPGEAPHFAPGYYWTLFEDFDGIRVEVNFIPGQGHLGPEGRLGAGGPGPASEYDEKGIRGGGRVG